MWECNCLVCGNVIFFRHMCVTSHFSWEKRQGCVGNPQENETNVCCVELNLGVSHKFSVRVIQRRSLLSLIYKISAHRP